MGIYGLIRVVIFQDATFPSPDILDSEHHSREIRSRDPLAAKPALIFSHSLIS
jgi:hypothetical protein